tara:strand:+ start:1014 stop:1235 length:222 start_codon:yes stop_codon:yes gene_type:complete
VHRNAWNNADETGLKIKQHQIALHQLIHERIVVIFIGAIPAVEKSLNNLRFTRETNDDHAIVAAPGLTGEKLR